MGRRSGSFAPVHASLASAYIEVAESGAQKPETAYGAAPEAIAHARRFDPVLAAVDSVGGHLKAVRDFDREGAEADLQRAIELSPSDADAYGRLCASPDSTMWLGQLGAAYGMAGETATARELLGRLEKRGERQFVSPYHLAYVHTGLGDADTAITLLERAVAARTGAAYGIKGSFLFAARHVQPRFQALLRRMRLA